MDYYLLNIKKKNNEVDDCIAKEKKAFIFYGAIKISEIKKGEKKDLSPMKFNQASLFIKKFEQINKDALILSIGEKHIYIYEQDGELQEYGTYNGKYEDQVKGFQIKIIKQYPIKKCPLILATIKSNKWLSLGTFKKIPEKYIGNILAIEYVISGNTQYVNNFKDYLSCLSSLEFETLIAKMKEEQGYFVPAYKGGYIKNFDLVCKDQSNNIELLQIKLKMTNKDIENNKGDIKFFYCIDYDSNIKENIRNWENIQDELKDCPKTMEWLKKTLDWVELKIPNEKTSEAIKDSRVNKNMTKISI